jgi:hypothetical protein
MGIRDLTAAALVLAAMLPTRALAADYADILGKWRVAQVRTVASLHGVQALADDDPLYMGAGIDFQLDGIVWLPRPQQRFEADACRAQPSLKPQVPDARKPGDGYAVDGGYDVYCGGRKWRPAVILPVDDRILVLYWFDNAVLTLKRQD